MRIKIKNRTVRGITWLPHGQQFTGWVPAGVYETDSEPQLVRFSDLGRMEETQAVALYACGAGHHGHWYATETALDEAGVLLSVDT